MDIQTLRINLIKKYWALKTRNSWLKLMKFFRKKGKMIGGINCRKKFRIQYLKEFRILKEKIIHAW